MASFSSVFFKHDVLGVCFLSFGRKAFSPLWIRICYGDYFSMVSVCCWSQSLSKLACLQSAQSTLHLHMHFTTYCTTHLDIITSLLESALDGRFFNAGDVKWQLPSLSSCLKKPRCSVFLFLSVIIGHFNTQHTFGFIRVRDTSH